MAHRPCSSCPRNAGIRSSPNVRTHRRGSLRGDNSVATEGEADTPGIPRNGGISAVGAASILAERSQRAKRQLLPRVDRIAGSRQGAPTRRWGFGCRHGEHFGRTKPTRLESFRMLVRERRRADGRLRARHCAAALLSASFENAGRRSVRRPISVHARRSKPAGSGRKVAGHWSISPVLWSRWGQVCSNKSVPTGPSR